VSLATATASDRRVRRSVEPAGTAPPRALQLRADTEAPAGGGGGGGGSSVASGGGSTGGGSTGGGSGGASPPSGGGGTTCGVPSGCPAEFCTPFGSTLQAQAVRAAMAPVLLAGIAAKVSPRVVPLWNQYLFGGAAPQNLTSRFGGDFAVSATTAASTDFLAEALRTDLESNPPTFPAGVNVTTVDIPSRIPAAITALGDPNAVDQMDFNVIGEIPGNIAGGIGLTQRSCPVGARPSPFDDARTAAGTALVVRNADTSLTVMPQIAFTVRDTIDLCPGNCGAAIEQIATVPMSRMEASGISGDVPFTVEFPGPPRVVTARPAPTPAPGPIEGEVTASQLRIRATPSTSAAIVGRYPRGTVVTLECQSTGTEVDGEDVWYRTDQGWIAGRYVLRRSADAPPPCP